MDAGDPTHGYGFVLDDDPTVLPDPRSPRQPDGRARALAAVVARPRRWTDGDWTGRSIDGAVIYELHVGTFTPEGTFDVGDRQARPPASTSASTSSS